LLLLAPRYGVGPPPPPQFTNNRAHEPYRPPPPPPQPQPQFRRREPFNKRERFVYVLLINVNLCETYFLFQTKKECKFSRAFTKIFVKDWW